MIEREVLPTFSQAYALKKANAGNSAVEKVDHLCLLTRRKEGEFLYSWLVPNQDI